MTPPTESASGRREGPLPADVPTDAEHITTPRDHRAEALAAQLQGRTVANEAADHYRTDRTNNTKEPKMSTANDVDQPTPRPPKSPELAEILMWRARALQNRAETRAAEAERDLWRDRARKWEARAKHNRQQQD